MSSSSLSISEIINTDSPIVATNTASSSSSNSLSSLESLTLAASAMMEQHSTTPTALATAATATATANPMHPSAKPVRLQAAILPSLTQVLPEHFPPHSHRHSNGHSQHPQQPPQRHSHQVMRPPSHSHHHHHHHQMIPCVVPIAQANYQPQPQHQLPHVHAHHGQVAMQSYAHHHHNHNHPQHNQHHHYPLYPPQLHPTTVPYQQQHQMRPRPPMFTVQSFKLDKHVRGFPPDPTVAAQMAKKARAEKPVELDPAVQACIAAAKALSQESSSSVSSASSIDVSSGSGLSSGEGAATSAAASVSETGSSVANSSAAATFHSHLHCVPQQLSSSGGGAHQISLNFRNFAITLGPRATNLTSNQYGTATADKSHYAAVMTDTLICTTLGLLEHFSDEYKPTVNNKLKALKFMEYLQERFQMHFCGSRSMADRLQRFPEKEELAVVYRMPDSLKAQYGHRGGLHVLRLGWSVGVAVYRASTGERLYSNSLASDGRFVAEGVQASALSDSSRFHHDVLDGVEDGDFALIFRGCALPACDALAKQLAALPPSSDLDELCERTNAGLSFKDGNIAIATVIGSAFDEFYAQPHQFRHIVHTERKCQLSIEQPWIYAITKHAFLLRPYLAMIYADASKINRFCPTIEFIVRKVSSPSAMSRFLMPSLSKLSEVQHMAGVLLRPEGRLRYWGTGGAFIALVDRRDPAKWAVSIPGFDDYSASAHSATSASVSADTTSLWCSETHLPVGEVNYHVGQLIFMLCPAVRLYWKRDELVELLSKSNMATSEKLSKLISRFTDERDFRSGVGAFEII